MGDLDGYGILLQPPTNTLPATLLYLLLLLLLLSLEEKCLVLVY